MRTREDPPMRPEDLIGVWIIRTFHMEDCTTGARTQPWGAHPSGTLAFHPGGRMFALITPDRRSRPATEAEEAAAFRSMLAYSGRYRVDPPNRLVTTVDIAWFEPWIGTEQVRFCDINGSILTLRSAPLRMPRQDAEMFAVVTWDTEGTSAVQQ